MTLAVVGMGLHAKEMQRTSVPAGGIGNCVGGQNVLGYRIKGKLCCNSNSIINPTIKNGVTHCYYAVSVFQNRRRSQNPFYLSRHRLCELRLKMRAPVKLFLLDVPMRDEIISK